MKKKIKSPVLKTICLLIILVGMTAPVSLFAEDIKLSSGQTVYVPIYSHIYSGVKGRPFDLAATLSIRNTNLKSPERLRLAHILLNKLAIGIIIFYRG